jgi:hypothetical protein
MKEWQKEKKEHPWTSRKQAKRIATDHAKKKQEHKHFPQKGGSPAVQAANRDFSGLSNGAKQIIKEAQR